MMAGLLSSIRNHIFATSNATCLTKQTDTDIQVVARSVTQVVPTRLNQYLPRAESQETN